MLRWHSRSRRSLRGRRDSDCDTAEVKVAQVLQFLMCDVRTLNDARDARSPVPRAPMLSFPHSDEYKHFIGELRAAREEAGLSQAELAARLKVDRTVITKAEGGVRRLDLIELRAWLIALDVELLSFVSRLQGRLDRNVKPTQPPRPRRTR